MVEKLEKVIIYEKIKTALKDLRIPKVFGIENRVNYAGDSSLAPLMDKANLDFYDLALKSLDLYGKEVMVYPHINLQARVTMGCNSQCGFCIERFDKDRLPELETSAYADRLEESIQVLQEQEIYPSVTITGGEPCLDPKRLEAVFDVFRRRNVTKFNVNTNGILLVERPDEYVGLFKDFLPYLNISMHHWDSKKAEEIMGGRRNIGFEDIAPIMEKLGGGQYGNNPRTRLQCVLLEGYVDNIDSMQEYLDRAREVGVDNVSFRGLSELSCGNYGQLNMVSMSDVLDQLGASLKEGSAKGWDFVCQNIADWYCYEDWKYGGDKTPGKWMDVHLNFSNMVNLRNFELDEKAKGKQYAREFVLFEDGTFSSGWNKDLGTLKK
jgi:molybdenum cofactor biosynthesis enzyme MoaA